MSVIYYYIAVPFPNEEAFRAPFFGTMTYRNGCILAPQNEGIKHYVPLYLPVVSKNNSTAIYELFLILIYLIAAVSQQIYPKLKVG